MRYILIGILVLTLSGCLDEKRFNAANEVSIKNSVQEIKNNLPNDMHEEFNRAVMYFSVGGEEGIKSIFSLALSGNIDATKGTLLVTNLQDINGLTGLEIIDKYKEISSEREKASAEREIVNNLANEAEALLKSNKFKQALEKYKEMGSVSNTTKAAEDGIAETNRLMKEFTNKMNYISNIKITEFIAKRIDTYTDKGVPAVRISLKNNGNRSLDMVKIVVYFQDKEGNTIFEEDFTPVRVSDYSFSNNKPLKAGYIREMEKDKYYIIDSGLSEWQEGQAVAKIVDIEFSK